MNIVSWTPFRDMESMFDRYTNLFDRMPSVLDDEMRVKGFDWRPTVDISETRKHYVIRVDLPEVDKEDVNVSIENGMLTISGERRFEKEEDTETTHRVESMYGKFSRSFTLPADVDETDISAKSKNGVLKVRIPKIEQQKEEPKKITVQ
jgi:HSP20 family protein